MKEAARDKPATRGVSPRPLVANLLTRVVGSGRPELRRHRGGGPHWFGRLHHVMHVVRAERGDGIPHMIHFFLFFMFLEVS